MGLVIRRVSRGDALPELLEFYLREWKDTSLRETDLFFVAYQSDAIVGAVRFCVESETAMFRSLLIDKNLRGAGIGKALVDACVAYMEEQQVGPAYCLPYPHLEKFYTSAGFEKIIGDQIPEFLSLRMAGYASRGSNVICMRRELRPLGT